jgi:predicted dithiol-disulfide oxidoreductase (DUF899 family)
MSEIEDLEREIHQKQERLEELRRQQPRQPVHDYELRAWDGRTIRLSETFGDKDDLIVIHNMGQSCSYCTMWADGFNGVVDHLLDRAAFMVVSPDPPAAQEKFARGRGWRFDMLSDEGSSFTEDMGFRSAAEGWLPGVSTFRRTPAGEIVRVAAAPLGPGDPFCAVWHLFGLLENGTEGWGPKFRYGR